MEKCFRLLRENEKTFPEIDQPICGKCATGPVLSGLAETGERFHFPDIDFTILIISAFLRK
jgi:hypothetical protein